jgi:hypothetical protein
MRHKPSDYRLMAAMCLEIANQMPADSDRTRIAAMAQRWLDLAQTSQADTFSDAGQNNLERDLG